MSIRAAVPADAGTAGELIYNAIQHIAYPMTGTNCKAEAIQALEQWFRRPANRFSYEQTQVMAQDGAAVGLILCYGEQDADRLDQPLLAALEAKGSGDKLLSFDKEAFDSEYYIDTLSVAPEYGGRGFGSRLIASAEQEAVRLGYRLISLNVEKGHHAAYSLYRKLGYRDERIIPIHDHPYIHMVKKLPPEAEQ